MKCTIPEISWHNRDPVLCLDIQPNEATRPASEQSYYRLASGGTDAHILIWHLRMIANGAVNIEPVCDLTRHQRAVNVVKWSPSGQYLASGDDDANIIVWQQRFEKDDSAGNATTSTTIADTDPDKEKWDIFKILRGHKEDVYDLSWSPDSQKLVSGSVDNTAVVWSVAKGASERVLGDHKGFVQGVSWNPQEPSYIATLSSDRTCRVFADNGRKVRARLSKGTLPFPDGHALHGHITRYYHDDTLKSFFRRLTFSPDGTLLITPAGYLELGGLNERNMYTTYIYTTCSLTQPAAVLPSPNQYTVVVRCCPVLFELWADGPAPAVTLPYRMVIAVASRTSITLYDTQQLLPFATIAHIHYTRLTDVTWSSDGRLLAVSSTDGFCSLVTFDVNELGVEYTPDMEAVHAPKSLTQINVNEHCANTVNDDVKPDKKLNFLEQWTSNNTLKTKLVADDTCAENEKENIVINRLFPVRKKQRTDSEKLPAQLTNEKINVPSTMDCNTQDSVTRDAWTCQKPTNCNYECEESMSNTVAEESHDFRLFLEDTETEAASSLQPEHDANNQNGEKDDQRQMEVSSGESVQVKQASEEKTDIDTKCDNNDKPQIPIVQIKKRVPFITVSSPKQKRK